jgi:transcriptional regulator with XRE-family HTH domain
MMEPGSSRLVVAGAVRGAAELWRRSVSIGAALAEARQRAGLTVAQVSERTRIRETVIRGIERDDYSGCGGDFYARGHIRGIAKAVGADPGPLVEEYDAVCRSPEVLSRVSLEELLATSAQAPQRRRPALPAVPRLVVAARSSLRHQAGSPAAREPVVPAARSPGRRLGWAVALALVVALGFGLYSLAAGPPQSAVAPSAAGKRSVTPQQAGPGKPDLVPQRSHAAAPHSPAPAVPARTLAPVAAAPRPSGGGHSPLAQRAVEVHHAAAVVGRSAPGRHRHHRGFGVPGRGHGPGHGHRPGHDHGPDNGNGHERDHRPGHGHQPGHGHGPDNGNGAGNGNEHGH